MAHPISLIRDSLRIPYKSENWLTQLVIGGVLVLSSVFFVPFLILTGYMLRVVRSGVDHRGTLPGFSNPISLAIDGVRWTVVSLVYLLIPTLVGLGGTVIISYAFSTWSLEVGVIVLMVIVLLTISLFFVAFYVLPIALVNVAVTRRITGAFDRQAIIPIAKNRSFPTIWAGWIGLLAVGSVLSGILAVLFVGVFVYFYIMAASHYLLGAGTQNVIDGVSNGIE